MHKKPAHLEESNLYPNHLTWPTRWRIPHFKDTKLGLACLDALEHERARMKLPVYAFALMPDHLHLLIGPCAMPVGYVVQALKLASVHRLMRDGMAGGALWQRGYWDVAMRDERSLHQAMEYIHNNPAKEGLVGNPSDYALSSYREWFGGGESPIQLAKNEISFVT